MRKLLILVCLLSVLQAYSGESKVFRQIAVADTTANDTTLKGVKMKEVVVTKDKRLPIFPSQEAKNTGPRVKSLSDIIGAKATDMILHPFAFRQRKHERQRKKALKQLYEFSLVKSNNELLREALIREGIDPDSLLRLRDQK